MPRRVHTNFQGLLVVFTLLSYIARGRLTEHCCSHLFWLCDTARRGLIISLSYFYYTLFREDCQGVCKSFFNFFSFARSAISPLDFIIIAHGGIKSQGVLRTFLQKFYLMYYSTHKTARCGRQRAAHKESPPKRAKERLIQYVQVDYPR